MTSPLRMQMIISGDASGLKSATASAKAEVSGLSNAASQSSSSMQDLAANNDKAAASAKRASEAARGQTQAENELRNAITSTVSATETKMQRLVAVFAGLHSGAANNNQRQWTGALAEEGMAVDQLRAKYSPMFAVIQRYRDAKAEIRTANAMGALSVNEMTAALGRERQAALASIDVIKGRSDAVKAANRNNFAATNTMFQLQDIGVTAAMGMNPAMIALQQGTQIAGGMSGMNLKQAGSTLLGAFTQLLSPVAFATVAVTGLTAAAVQYAISWTGNAKDLSTTLTEHEEQIKRLSEAYRYAGTGAEAYFQRVNSGTRFQAYGSRQDLEKALKNDTGTMLGQLGRLSTGSIWGDANSPAGEGDQWAVNGRFKEFETAILHLQQTAKDGKPDILGFRQLVEDRWSIDRNNDSLKKIAKELLDLAPNAVLAAIALERFEKIRADNAANAARRRASAYSEGISGLRGIAALQNSDRRQVEEDYATARGNAGDRDERADALKQRNDALARINAAEQRQNELTRIDLQLQVARDPVTRAQLSAERERIELTGKNIDATEVETRAQQARNRVMAEALAQSSAQIIDLRAEVEARKKVNDALAAGNISAADAALYLRLEAELRPQIIAAAKTEGEERQKLLEIIRQQVELNKERAEQDKRASALDFIKSQQERIAGLKVELALVGETESVRNRVMAQFEAELKIRQLGLQASSDEARQLRANAIEMENRNQQIEKQADAWKSVRDAGEDALDTLVDKLGSGDFSGALEDISKDLSKTILQLGVTNPLKNGLLGTNYGTINDVGGFGGIISKLFGGGEVDANGIIQSALGATTTGSMNVQAAVVNIGGAGIGGLDVSRIFNPANSNIPAGSDISQYAAAIRNIESRGSGGYSALGPITATGDRAYGAYQVMGANIPSWTKSALGFSMSPQQFLGSQEAQDAVFNKIFGGYVGKYGASGAAQAWFAGPGSIGRGGNASDMLGTSISQYVGKFESEVQKMAGATSTATSNVTSLGTGLDAASTGLSKLGTGLDEFGGGLQGLARNLSNMGSGGFSLGSLFPGLGGFKSQQLANAIASGTPGLWEDGGFTGWGGRKDVAGYVHGQEFVVKASVVARPGVRSFLEQLNSDRQGYESGGFVSPLFRRGSSGGNGVWAGGSSPQVQFVTEVNNYSSASVQTKEESDGRGGKRQAIIIQETMADAATQPGSAFGRAMPKKWAMRPRVLKL